MEVSKCDLNENSQTLLYYEDHELQNRESFRDILKLSQETLIEIETKVFEIVNSSFKHVGLTSKFFESLQIIYGSQNLKGSNHKIEDDQNNEIVMESDDLENIFQKLYFNNRIGILSHENSAQNKYEKQNTNLNLSKEIQEKKNEQGEIETKFLEYSAKESQKSLIKKLIELIEKNSKNYNSLRDEVDKDILSWNEYMMEDILCSISKIIDTLVDHKNKTKSLLLFRHLQANLLLMNAMNFKRFDMDIKRMNKLYLISSGAQASVYRVYDYFTKKSYAFRIFDIQNISDMILAFREIKILTKIMMEKKTVIINIYDIILENNSLSVTYEYGLGDLNEFIKFLRQTGKKITSAEFTDLSEKIENQFKIFQKMNIYHRDIKPSNIIIDENWNLKFIDFGLAEMIEHEYLKFGYFPTCGTISFWHPDIDEAFKNSKSCVKIDLEEADKFSIKKVLNILYDITMTGDETNAIIEGLNLREKYEDEFSKHQKSKLFSILANANKKDVVYFEKSYLYDEAIAWIDARMKNLDKTKQVEKLVLKIEKAQILNQMEKFKESEELQEICRQDFEKIEEFAFSEDNYFLSEYQNYKANDDFREKISYSEFVKIKLEIEYFSLNSSKEKNLNSKKNLIVSIGKIYSGITNENDISLATTYNNIGQVYSHQSRFEEALEYYHKSLDINIKILGSNHTSVATNYNDIGKVYSQQARYEEALEYLHKSLDILIKIEGSNHTSVATTYNNIGQVYYHQSRFEEALEYYRKSLDINIKILGSNHTSVATNYNDIGNVYSQQARYEEALEYLHKSLDILIKIVGSNHTSVATTYENIAQVYSHQARYEEALKYLHKSLDMIIKIVGSNHMSVATTYKNIGQVYFHQARYEYALEYYHKSLDINIKILGSNHKYVATICNKLAQVYYQQSKFEEALEYYHKSLDINIETLGSINTSVANAYFNIAKIFSHQARYEKLIEYLQKSLDILIKILGTNHTSVATTYNKIGQVYFLQARYEEALECYHKSLDINFKILGSNHASVATNYNNIGQVYSQQAMYEEALDYYDKSLDINIKVLGSNHKYVANIYSNLAQVYYQQSRYQEALNYYHKSLDIKIKILGSNHTSVASYYNKIAKVYSRQARYDKALEYYHMSLGIIKFGSNYEVIATIYIDIAQVHSYQANYKEELSYLLKFHDVAINFLRLANPPKLIAAYHKISSLYFDEAEYEKSFVFYKKSIEIRCKNFLENKTLDYLKDLGIENMCNDRDNLENLKNISIQLEASEKQHKYYLMKKLLHTKDLESSISKDQVQILIDNLICLKISFQTELDDIYPLLNEIEDSEITSKLFSRLCQKITSSPYLKSLHFQLSNMMLHQIPEFNENVSRLMSIDQNMMKLINYLLKAIEPNSEVKKLLHNTEVILKKLSIKNFDHELWEDHIDKLKNHFYEVYRELIPNTWPQMTFKLPDDEYDCLDFGLNTKDSDENYDVDRLQEVKCENIEFHYQKVIRSLLGSKNVIQKPEIQFFIRDETKLESPFFEICIFEANGQIQILKNGQNISINQETLDDLAKIKLESLNILTKDKEINFEDESVKNYRRLLELCGFNHAPLTPEFYKQYSEFDEVQLKLKLDDDDDDDDDDDILKHISSLREDISKMYMLEGWNNYKKKDYSKAYDAFQLALIYIDSFFISSIKESSLINFTLAYMLSEIGNDEEAFYCYETAILHPNALLFPWFDLNLESVLVCLIKLKRYKELYDYYERYKNILAGKFIGKIVLAYYGKKNHRDRADNQMQDFKTISILYTKNDEFKLDEISYDSALAYFFNSLNNDSRNWGESNRTAKGNIFKRISEIYFQQEKYKEALENHNKYLEFRQIKIRQSQYKNALQYYNTSLSFITSKFYPDNTDLVLIIKSEFYEEFLGYYYKNFETLSFKTKMFPFIQAISRIYETKLEKIITKRDQDGFKLISTNIDHTIDLKRIEYLDQIADSLFSNNKFLAARNICLQVDYYMSFDFHKNLESKFSSISKKIYHRFPLIMKKVHSQINLSSEIDKFIVDRK